ncbi:hypothetical protein [Mollivirus kamchatka]|nr:hypothetical protein [Mollivirus kamchatka]
MPPNSPYVGNYVGVPNGLRMEGQQMRADVLARLSRVLGIDAHEALAFDASLCVTFAYINWCLDDRLLDYVRAMPFEWSEEMADLPIAQRTAAFGLVDPYSVPVYHLYNWATVSMASTEESNYDQTDIFPLVPPAFDSPVGIRTAAVAGKVVVQEPQVFPRKQQALFFSTSERRSNMRYSDGEHLDAVHTISASELAAITGIDQSLFDQWLDPFLDPAQSQAAYDQIQAIMEDWYQRFWSNKMSFKPGEVGEALLQWIDDNVSNYLTGKCDAAYRVDPEHFPRFSTVFDIYSTLVTPTNEPGQAVILAHITNQRHHPFDRAVAKQAQEDKAALALAAAAAMAAVAQPVAAQPKRSWLSKFVSNWQ